MLTSSLCAILLFRAHRHSQLRLLFWSGICFATLALNNLLLFVDLIIIPDVDLALLRNLTALVGVGSLLLSLIWDSL
jgi:hypothetical protein